MVIRIDDGERGWAVAHRATGKVVEIAGGKVAGLTKSDAETMAAVLSPDE